MVISNNIGTEFLLTNKNIESVNYRTYAAIRFRRLESPNLGGIDHVTKILQIEK